MGGGEGGALGAGGFASVHEWQQAAMHAGLEEERRAAARARRDNMSHGVSAPRSRPQSAAQSGAASHGAASHNAAASRREGFARSPAVRGRPAPRALPAGPSAGTYRPSRELDTHELLKQEAFGSAAASCDDHFEKSRPCPTAVYGVNDHYVVLDSFEKVDSSDTARGQLKFNFAVQGVTRDQAIGVKDKIDTVIGIQVCELCIPLLPFNDFDADRLTALNPGLGELNLTQNQGGSTDAGWPAGDAVTSPQSQIPFCGRVTAFFEEIGLQSFSDVDNRRHHFEFKASEAGETTGDGGDRLELRPLRHCEYFLFTDPIQDVHGLTVRLFNPGNTLALPPDCLYGTTAQTDGAQNLTFSYTDPTNLINLEIGDRIYIRGFEAYDLTAPIPSGGSAADQEYKTLNTFIGRPEGHQIGEDGFVVSAPSSTGTTVTFRLNPNISTASLQPAPIPANTSIASRKQIVVCVAKNRVRMALRLRGVVGRLTNYIAP